MQRKSLLSQCSFREHPPERSQKDFVPNFVMDFGIKRISETKALLVGRDAYGSVDSSGHGEQSGQVIPNVDPSRLADYMRGHDNGDTNGEPIYDDTYGDIISFVESMMDVLDHEAINDIYTFLASLDSGVTVAGVLDPTLNMPTIADSGVSTAPLLSRLKSFVPMRKP
jgi:hypothetical protein